jgi:predicted aspartyl protease
MQAVPCYFNSKGSPCLKISVYGDHEQNAQEFEGLLDTGFSGFLSIPLLKAFPCALILQGTASFTLADGAPRVYLVARGTVILGDERETGLVVLNNEATDVLIGMDFLRLFKKALFVSQHGVALLDESIVQAGIRAAQQSSLPTPPETPIPIAVQNSAPPDSTPSSN